MRSGSERAVVSIVNRSKRHLFALGENNERVHFSTPRFLCGEQRRSLCIWELEGMIENVVYASRHNCVSGEGLKHKKHTKQHWRVFLGPIMNFCSEMLLQTKTFPEKTHYGRASEVTWLHKQDNTADKALEELVPQPWQSSQMFLNFAEWNRFKQQVSCNG